MYLKATDSFTTEKEKNFCTMPNFIEDRINEVGLSKTDEREGKKRDCCCTVE